MISDLDNTLKIYRFISSLLLDAKGMGKFPNQPSNKTLLNKLQSQDGKLLILHYLQITIDYRNTL